MRKSKEDEIKRLALIAFRGSSYREDFERWDRHLVSLTMGLREDLNRLLDYLNLEIYDVEAERKIRKKGE